MILHPPAHPIGEPSCIWPIAASLGEGPLWHPAQRVLWFTDIIGCRLHRYDPATSACRSYSVPHGVGFVVCAEGGGLILGMDGGLHLFKDRQITRRIAQIANPAPGTRINDGTVDRHGRIWFGTMDEAQRAPTGRVHMHAGKGPIHVAGGDAIITNGPALSACGTTLYHVDTTERLVWRFDVSDGHHLHHGEVFARIDRADGAPDGVTLDAEGCLWVCLWGGWCVRRYAPDGRLLASVALPVSQVTKLAFGGEDLRTAYVTSARTGLRGAALLAQPLAGGLFAFDAGVAGVAAVQARQGPLF